MITIHYRKNKNKKSNPLKIKMKEIFESPEFLALERLCHRRKCSFILAVTKFSSCIKPKLPASYVISEFFVENVPESWERLQIRATPTQSWLNPAPPPPLSSPLSQLVNNTRQIKADFLEVWNHIHGVMTENYYCPKLYLTQMPRHEVGLYMDIEKLPDKEFLSCVDIVYFPVFAAWIKSNAAEDESDENVMTRVRFVALLIHLAFKLYKLDPESHIKSSVTAVPSSSSRQLVDVDNSDNEDPASDVEIILTEQSETALVEGDGAKREEATSAVNNLPTLRVKKTTEINQELDFSISKSSCTETTSKILCQPPGKAEVSVLKHSNGVSESTRRRENVITLEPVLQSTILVDSSNSSSVISIEDEEIEKSFVDLISDSDGEASTETEDIVGTQVKICDEEDVSPGSDDKPGEGSKPDKGIIVSVSLGRLIQVCVRLLSQEEYKVFSRKISKYLNYLPEAATKSERLASFIDIKCGEVRKDSKNVFLYLKEVFDQMKKFRKDGIESSSEEVMFSMENQDQASREKVKTESVETEICDEEDETEYEEEISPGDVKVEEEKTLKAVLQSFLENSQNKFSSRKQFQPHFKQILKLMNNLDPNHVNSTPLKEFVSEHSDLITAENVLGHVEAVTKEIEKYLKTKKRPAETEERPAGKRVCLTSISSSVTAAVEVPEQEDRANQPREVSLPAEAEESQDLGASLPSLPSTLTGSGKPTKTKKSSARHIKKLEKALESCRKEISRLEEAEVDFEEEEEEEEESNYLLCAKYKRRYMQLFNKIAKAKEMSGNLDRNADKKLKCSQSRYPEINAKIEKFVNKTRQFPDFQDIRSLVTEANSSLQLAPTLLHEEAEKVFRAVGRQLQARRQADEAGVMMSYLREDQQEDPATKDQDLQRLLVEQGEEGRRRLEEFFDNFEQRQAASHAESEANRGKEEEANKEPENV